MRELLLICVFRQQVHQPNQRFIYLAVFFGSITFDPFTVKRTALPGILPEETMIIGDSLTADIAGGRKMGMRTCWYDREKTGRSDEADVTIQNLCILKKIL